MGKKFIVMNFGSTSTKLALYEDREELCRESIQYDPDTFKDMATVFEQQDIRTRTVADFLEKHGTGFDHLSCVITRGGHWRPVPSGIFEISAPMVADLKTGKWGVHPADVGVLMAYDLGQRHGIPALSADAAITDEFCGEARFTGIKGIWRISSFHVLNHKAIARRYAREMGADYESLDLIVAHLGGGCSVAAHQKGRMVDANNALDGDGPFSPERAGTVPAGSLVELCFCGRYSQGEVKKMLTGRGGVMSHLGTSDMRLVEKMVEEGDEYAARVFKAMVYQIAKEIGQMAAVLQGSVNAILLTGSIAYSEKVVAQLSRYVSWIAPVKVYAGEDEIWALAENACRYLYGEQAPLDYEKVALADPG